MKNTNSPNLKDETYLINKEKDEIDKQKQVIEIENISLRNKKKKLKEKEKELELKIYNFNKKKKEFSKEVEVARNQMKLKDPERRLLEKELLKEKTKTRNLTKKLGETPESVSELEQKKIDLIKDIETLKITKGSLLHKIKLLNEEYNSFN